MSDPAPPAEPISLEEAKLNLRLDTNADDLRVQALIVGARQYVESYTGLVLTPRTVTETASRLGPWIDLASWPVQEVTAIRYPGADGALTALPSTNFALSKTRRPARVIPSPSGWGVNYSWTILAAGERPRATLPVEIDVQAGYATPDLIPEIYKQAMHLLIAHFYANRAAAEVGARAAAIEIPFGVVALLAGARDELS